MGNSRFELSRKKKFKINTTILIAVITSGLTFCGTIISAALASPLIIKAFEKPPAVQEIQIQTGEGTKETTQISLISNQHLITSQDLKRLDLNNYYIDESLEIAVKRIAGGGWEINTFNTLPTISMIDVPMMGLGTSAIGGIYFDQAQQTIFGVRQIEGYEIILDRDSMISSMPMDLNLYDNLEYVRASLESQASLMKKTNPAQAEFFDLMLQDEILTTVQEELSMNFEAYLDTQLPATKQVHSGVYVIPINSESLDSNLFLEVVPESTLLDRAMNYLSFSGLFSAGIARNTIVDQKEGIASFQASVELENVKVDGKPTNATLNNIGFIVAGEERAILVVLIYLDVDNISLFDELRDIFNSLKFTR